MTLPEFLAPFRAGTNQDRVLAVMYFYERYEDKTAVTVAEIRSGLRRARVRRAGRINVADVLAKSGPYLDTGGTRGREKLWSLTETGRQLIRGKLDLPAADVEVEHDVGALEQVVQKISNPEIKDYLEEAVKCLQVGALRACVVFVWSGAIRTIQERILSAGGTGVTAALQKHDPKCRSVTTIDDFAYVKDDTTLLAARDLGVLDKNQKDTLKEALGLRNRSGHPGKYRPGVKKVSSYIEDVVSIVFWLAKAVLIINRSASPSSTASRRKCIECRSCRCSFNRIRASARVGMARVEAHLSCRRHTGHTACVQPARVVLNPTSRGSRAVRARRSWRCLALNI